MTAILAVAPWRVVFATVIVLAAVGLVLWIVLADWRRP